VRILVVDDEQAISAVLRDVLELEGYEVEVCCDVTSARTKLSERRFDAAILDVFLSDRPVGLDLGREILTNYPETSLLFMTGYADDIDIQAGYASGAYGCIRKPFDLDDVVRALGVTLDGRRSGQVAA